MTTERPLSLRRAAVAVTLTTVAALAFVFVVAIVPVPEAAGRETTSQPSSATPTAAVTTSPTAEAGNTPPRPFPNGASPSATPSLSPSASRSATQPPSPKAKPKPSASAKRTRPSARPSSRPSTKPKSSKRTTRLRKPPKRRGVVYLTFDDGPSLYTPAILRILRASDSTATFFQLGLRRQQLPGIARQVRAQGSTIGNHTYDHANLSKLPPSSVRWEINNGPRSRCVRPPFGASNAAVRDEIRRMGAREVLWSVDTLDWTRPGVSKLEKVATRAAVTDESIVLMHDGGGDRSQTVAALTEMIRILHGRGFVIRHLPGC